MGLGLEVRVRVRVRVRGRGKVRGSYRGRGRGRGRGRVRAVEELRGRACLPRRSRLPRAGVRAGLGRSRPAGSFARVPSAAR